MYFYGLRKDGGGRYFLRRFSGIDARRKWLKGKDDREAVDSGFAQYLIHLAIGGGVSWIDLDRALWDEGLEFQIGKGFENGKCQGEAEGGEIGGGDGEVRVATAGVFDGELGRGW